MASIIPKQVPLQAQTMDSPFSSKIVLITIGPQREPFNIHVGKLTKTAFLDIHGPLPTEAEKLERANFEMSMTTSIEAGDATIKRESGGESSGEVEVVVTASEGDFNAAQETTNGKLKAAELPDYHIQDRFHTPAAFKVFAMWLYSEPPAPLKYRSQCQIYLQTYVLARLYKAYALQNLILQRFREFHIRTHVNFDDLIWIANRVGEDISSCVMTAYLLEQVAFEIADRGFDGFASTNLYLTKFLSEGDLRNLRLQLFRAITKHAQASSGRLGDPAEGENIWLVYESGRQAGIARGPRGGN